MATKTVRLHRLPDGRLESLERTPARLARVAGLGGRVWDVEVERGPFRREA